MSFSLICLLGIVATVPFGLAFIVAPEATAAQYGVSGWTPGTLFVARLFGVAFLYVGGAAYAARQSTDAALQKRFASTFALSSLIATALSIHAVTSGAVNAVAWSTVLTYAFFTLAWGSIIFRKGP